jgi:hypothetical protein
LLKAEELSTANLEDQLSIQRDRLKLAEWDLANTNKEQQTREQILKIEEEKAKLYELETQAINEQSMILRRRVTVERELAAVAKARADEAAAAATKELERLKAETAAVQTEVDRQNAIFAAQREKKKQEEISLGEWKKEQTLINEENQLEIRLANNENIFDIERGRLILEQQQEIEAAQKTGASVYGINKKYKAYNVLLAKEEQAAKQAIYAGFAGSLASLFGEQTSLGRAAAVAQATINTYLGATAAFAQTPGGIVIKSIAAAGAVVSGLASVKKILSTKSGLPGDSGGGGASGSNPYSSQSAPIMATRTFEGSPVIGSAQMDSVEAFKIALKGQPPVLVKEDYENVSNRSIQVKESAML